MIPRISYRKLFEYAHDNYSMEWAECYRTFVKTNILKYEGTTETFYLEDLEMDLQDENFPPMFRTPFATGLHLVELFMLDNGYNEIKFRHY